MGIGPVSAVRKALQHAGLTMTESSCMITCLGTTATGFDTYKFDACRIDEGIEHACSI